MEAACITLQLWLGKLLGLKPGAVKCQAGSITKALRINEERLQVRLIQRTAQARSRSLCGEPCMLEQRCIKRPFVGGTGHRNVYSFNDNATEIPSAAAAAPPLLPDPFC